VDILGRLHIRTHIEKICFEDAAATMITINTFIYAKIHLLNS